MAQAWKFVRKAAQLAGLRRSAVALLFVASRGRD
jgi:hypothetical protein